MTRSVVCTLVFAVAACAGGKDSGKAQAPAEDTFSGQPVSKSVELGPVKATVSVVPAKPKVGDKLQLVLRVESEANVDIEMPPGTEALGQFRILRLKELQGELDGNKKFFEQRVVMRPGGSGKQYIPKLRVEFVDNRKLAGMDGGVAKPQELLTDELVIEVQSVKPAGEIATSLAGARDELKPPSETVLAWLWPWLAALAVMALVAVSLTWYLRLREAQVRVSAYETAITRFDTLQNRGMPGADEADEWYVELSSIVRHYLEGRYSLRAPELTTEEFLREARRSADISDAHRALLSKFLERCDRVKFAGYRPEKAESKELFDSARSFVEQTKQSDDTAPAEQAPEMPAGATA